MVGDLHQSLPPAVRQIADQRDLDVNLVDCSFFGIACRTILGMDSRMAQAYLHTLERPLFSVRVHADGHAGASSQRGQKQFVRIRSPVMTPVGRLIRLEAVLSDSYRLKKTLALRIYDDSSGHISPMKASGSWLLAKAKPMSKSATCAADDCARTSAYRPLLMLPKSLTQNSLEYLTGAAPR
jgi:hypothetical protein